MIAAGMLSILLSIYGVYAAIRGRIDSNKLFLKLMLPAISLPFIANSAGWIMTEVGRQPWVVFGLQRTEHGVSPTVSALEVGITMVSFTLVYGLLAAAFVYLVVKIVREKPAAVHHHVETKESSVTPL